MRVRFRCPGTLIFLWSRFYPTPVVLLHPFCGPFPPVLLLFRTDRSLIVSDTPDAPSRPYLRR